MTTPCKRNTRTALTRTGALAVVFGIAFAPTAAYAAPGDPATVKALIAGDGSVSSVERLPDGAAPAASDIPVKIGISQASEGDVTTTNYQVTNTSVQKKTVEYVGADGLPATMEQDVALPLVAQLAVRLPASRTDVTAFGARITKLADGSSELVWSMVLFAPIGAPITDVSFSAKGKGEPIARLDVAAVQPNSEPGLSATSQAANATVNGNGILGTVGTGASEGLTKLGEGVGKLLDGLNKLEAGAIKLNAGLVGASDGAEQLSVGGGSAKTGAADLSAGLQKIAVGNGSLAEGLRSTRKQPDLTGGATAVATNLKTIAEGLATLDAGVSKILDPTTGLEPKMRAGSKQVQDAINAAVGAGIGTPTTDKTLLNGLFKLQLGLDNPTMIGGKPGIKQGLETSVTNLGTASGGLAFVLAGLDNADPKSPGARQALKNLQVVLDCPATSSPQPCTKIVDPIPSVTTQQTLFNLLAKLGQSNGDDDLNNGTAIDTVSDVRAGLSQAATSTTKGIPALLAGIGATPATGTPQKDVPETLLGGIYLLGLGLDNPAFIGATPGVKQGLAIGLQQGFDQYVTGVIAGVRSGIVGDARTPGTLKSGTVPLAAGASQLSAGASTLAEKLNGAADGAATLAAGSVSAAAGAGKLSDGVSKIADGNKKLADGLPAATDGSGAIAEGLGAVITGEKTVGEGIASVNSQAVAVLQSQFKQGTTLARQQLAGLDAATALAASTPGVQNTTYVLTQSKGDITATLASADGGGNSNMARNLGLGAGGVLLLLGGVAGGFVSGRKASVG